MSSFVKNYGTQSARLYFGAVTPPYRRQRRYFPRVFEYRNSFDQSSAQFSGKVEQNLNSCYSTNEGGSRDPAELEFPAAGGGWRPVKVVHGQRSASWSRRGGRTSQANFTAGLHHLSLAFNPNSNDHVASWVDFSGCRSVCSGMTISHSILIEY